MKMKHSKRFLLVGGVLLACSTSLWADDLIDEVTGCGEISKVSMLKPDSESLGVFVVYHGKKKDTLSIDSLSDIENMQINTAKTNLSCEEDGKVHIVSQFPFSASYSEFAISLKNGKPVVSMVGGGNPSQDAIDELIASVLAGNRPAIDELEIMYPSRYVSGSLFADILSQCDKVGLKLYNAQNRAGAIKRFDLAIEMINKLAKRYLLNDESNRRGATLFTEVVKSSEMESSQWVEPINNYGFYLQGAGRNSEALLYLRMVVTAAPNRTPAHLNLADAAWEESRRIGGTAGAPLLREAKSHYSIYAKQMNAKKRKVLDRVNQRIL